MKNTFFNIETNTLFPVQNLPYGIISTSDNPKRRVAVRIGEFALDLAYLAQEKLLLIPNITPATFDNNYLNDLMALPKSSQATLREHLQTLLTGENPALQNNTQAQNKALIPLKMVNNHMPVYIRDYTDFYSSMQHASNIGKMFRDPDNALLPNWKHLPVGYHGRASSVVMTGTNIKRPHGQILNQEQQPIFSETKRLDIELELGFFVGHGNTLGESISTQEALDKIFGISLVNDWSARDIQKWEYVPLGPFLAKSFATSIAAWVTPLEAIAPFRQLMPVQDDPQPVSYLHMPERYTYDIKLQVAIKTQTMQDYEIISQTNFTNMYWCMEQQLAHHTVNGCNVNTGDLMASGTISGDDPQSYGSLLEMTWAGKNPLHLSSGEERIFLKDGDSIRLTGYCEKDGLKIGLGEVEGKITA